MSTSFGNELIMGAIMKVLEVIRDERECLIIRQSHP